MIQNIRKGVNGSGKIFICLFIKLSMFKCYLWTNCSETLKVSKYKIFNVIVHRSHEIF